MRVNKLLACLSIVVLGAGLVGCSFSASFNSEGKAVLNGKDAIVVKATQPAPPPAPLAPKPVVIKPLKAKLVGKKIEITEKVMFDYNKASIKVESNDLLNDVGTILKQYESIKKIRIEGHTDGDGKAKYNKKLSQKRANSVKEFLVAAGIDESRLEAVGYGEEKPIADNKTEEGKEKNRRVEFNIVEGSAQKMVEVKAKN